MADVYTAREVATLLKLHYNTVMKLISDGTIKAFKIGRDWRITAAEVARLMKDGK